MAAYSLPRGGRRDTSKLRAALFSEPSPPAGPDGVAELTARIEQLEAKLRAIEEHPGIDPGALRAAIAHTRLLCTPSGYVLGEADEPPPTVGATIEHDGTAYTVWRLAPSPLPGDTRRCAVLV